HRPDLPFGERLTQIWEVGERLHHLHVLLALQLALERVEVELTFEVVHPGFHERLAVKRAPESDGPELLTRSQTLVGEIGEQLVGRQIHVREDDDPGGRLLQHLCPPPRLSARIKPLATMKSELFKDAYQPRKMLAGRAISVMVVVGPTDPELVLPGFLHLCGTIPPLPVLPLGGEEQVTGAIHAQIGNRALQQPMGLRESLLSAIEQSPPQSKRLKMLQHRHGFM